MATNKQASSQPPPRHRTLALIVLAAMALRANFPPEDGCFQGSVLHSALIDTEFQYRGNHSRSGC